MSDGREAHLAEVLGELQELRAENSRLRGLLGLDQRRADGHETAWTPTLFDQATPRPTIDGSVPLEAKAALLRSLFGGRSEVFATRWENGSTGKAGWSPAVRGGWSRKRGPQGLSPAHQRGAGSPPPGRADRRDLCFPDFSVIGDPLEQHQLITCRPIEGDDTVVDLVIQCRHARLLPQAARDLHRSVIDQARAITR